jgi:hypothetical protein
LLANNTSFRNFARFTDIRTVAVFGGVGYGVQRSELKRGVDIIVATPGRLVDYLKSGEISLRDINILILDEPGNHLDVETVDALATTVRAVVADADEAAQSLESELKLVRDEMKKAAKSAAQSADKVEASLDAIREEVREAHTNPSVASAPSSPSVTASETEAVPAPAEDEADEDVEVIEEIEEEEAEVTPAAPESAADGTGTALIVNLMIGIGNKPFVRGTGPGLSQDKGVPMSFLGIGRWQWISPDPEAPATVEVWKNDQSPMGEPLHLSGGEPLEVDEGHFGGV